MLQLFSRKSQSIYLLFGPSVSSKKYCKAVRSIDKALKVTGASLVKVPFDLEHWQKGR